MTDMKKLMEDLKHIVGGGMNVLSEGFRNKAILAANIYRQSITQQGGERMTFRKWMATKLWPEYEEIENKFYRLRSEIDTAYRWLGEFADTCEVLNWVRGIYHFGDADIYNFREKLRRKKAAWKSATPSASDEERARELADRILHEAHHFSDNGVFKYTPAKAAEIIAQAFAAIRADR